MIRRRSQFKEDLNTFYKKCTLTANCANIKANIFYYLYHFCSVSIILLSIAIGISGLVEKCNGIVTGSLGFVITAIKMAIAIYSPEKQCTQLKMISQQLHKIATGVRRLGTLGLEVEVLEQRYEMFVEQFNNLDLSTFDVGTQSKIITMLSRSLDQDKEIDLP